MVQRFLLLSLTLGLQIYSAYGHEGKNHKAAPNTKNIKPGRSSEALKEINSLYIKNIRPVFQRKCFDCHSNNTRYPWYSNLPLVKDLINDDITEAKKHMDMSNDFPFQGHGSPFGIPQKNCSILEKHIVSFILHWT